MKIELNGKKALVTGSSGGIGQAIAQGWPRPAPRWCCTAATPASWRAPRRRSPRACPARLGTVQADLATADGAASICAAHPDVDILVNNAGYFAPKSFTEITDDDWQYMLDVNVMSGVRLSRYYLPRLLAANWGASSFCPANRRCRFPRK